MAEPLLIVGNGMAAARLAEGLAQHCPRRHAVTIIGAEPHLAYNRVLLSDVLAGKIAAADTQVRPPAWWREAGIQLVLGTPAAGIDRAARRLHLADGRALPYRRLVLATGSDPIRLPLPGADLPGVVTFRDLADVQALMAVPAGARAVVIGGGLLGIEAASGLAAAGVETTLVHLMDRLMERQLDARAGALLRAATQARGIHVRLASESAAILGTTHAEGLRLGDGTVLPADIVVMACGVRPNTGLARAAGLACGRGVRVDDRLATSDPDIFAIGECAEHRGQCYGLVAPAQAQADVLARALAGQAAMYEGSSIATHLKVSGVFVFSAGDITAPGEEIVLQDRGLGLYRRLVVAQDRLISAVLYGDTADGAFYLDLIANRTPIGPLRADLAFGRPLACAA